MSNKGFGYTGRLRVLMQLTFDGNLPEIRYIPRYCYFLSTAILLAPLKIYERIVLTKKVKTNVLKEDPVFILGHMRSGTTHLHNLMCQDVNFAFPDTFQTHSPEYYVYGKRFLSPFFKYIVPEKRPMDNMKVSVDLPQEEEFAICAISRHSFFYHMLYPKRMDYFFNRYVLHRDLDKREMETWQDTYRFVIKKFSLTSNNKRLILKNPVNTGRSKLLLSMYPRASFVFIHRNPYEVFLSTKNLYRKVMPLCQLQSISWEKVDEMILRNYVLQMNQYFEDRMYISKEQLVEIAYKDLEDNPLETLKIIYKQLGFDGYEGAYEQFSNYIEGQRDYQKNKFEITNKEVVLVNETCSEIFEKLGYRMIIAENS
jgi:hypothetical protein